jgi:hypothetical protein
MIISLVILFFEHISSALLQLRLFETLEVEAMEL